MTSPIRNGIIHGAIHEGISIAIAVAARRPDLAIDLTVQNGLKAARAGLRTAANNPQILVKEAAKQSVGQEVNLAA